MLQGVMDEAEEVEEEADEGEGEGEEDILASRARLWAAAVEGQSLGTARAAEGAEELRR